MKIFLSQLMRGKTPEEIKSEREIATKCIKEVYPDAEIIDSYDESDHSAVYKLGTAIQKMSEADYVYFLPEAISKGRGCLIEFAVAKAYGIKTIGL